MKQTIKVKLTQSPSTRLGDTSLRGGSSLRRRDSQDSRRQSLAIQKEGYGTMEDTSDATGTSEQSSSLFSSNQNYS